MSWIGAVRARLRLLLAGGEAEARMEEEIGFHIEMEAQRLVREQGLDPAEARRRALVSFGGVEKTREELREGRGLSWLRGLRLDLKLGARMLVKYPVLTSASVLALSIAVALAASWFEFGADLTFPRLPLPEGERIVRLENRDLETAGLELQSMRDFDLWRSELETVEDLTALAPVAYSVVTEDDRYEALEGYRTMSSLFRVARVQPLLGRYLLPSDDDPAAPPVAVLGYDAWQRLYGGDRSVIGQTLRLGSTHATIVGVMPEGFGFPVNEEIWTPLRETPSHYEWREGPPIRVIGRLAPGATLEEARAELTAVGQRMTVQQPSTHERLRPDLRRFPGRGDMALVAAGLNLPFLLFLVVVSANIATLLLARTATRESEIALRSALGASRRRIVLQLVAEALVLTTLAAALGLAIAAWGLRWGMDLFWEVQQTRPPFWFDSGLSPLTVVYVLSLATVGALIIGGMPALRTTRRRLWTRIAQPGAGGSGMRFGVVATGVIVLQVALCVAFLPVAIVTAQEMRPVEDSSDFAAASFLTGRLAMEVDPSTVEAAPAGEDARDSARAALFDDVQRRISALPGVVAATRASRVPGFNHPVEEIELEQDSAVVLQVRALAVDPGYFDVVGARISGGRGLVPSDAAGDGGAIIVDTDWAAAVFDGRSPLGQRIRFTEREGEEALRWHEVVGVVSGMDRAAGPGEDVGIYYPLRPERAGSVQFYLRAAGSPDVLAPDVQALVTSIDPRLGVTDLLPLDRVWRPVQRADRFFTAAISGVAALILLFALCGTYALTSFSVTQRTREIGIRAALGADPRRILVAIFSRAMAQVGGGIVLGIILISLALSDAPGGPGLVAAVAAGMAGVGVAACVLPARRALRIQPIEALRAE